MQMRTPHSSIAMLNNVITVILTKPLARRIPFLYRAVAANVYVYHFKVNKYEVLPFFSVELELNVFE